MINFNKNSKLTKEYQKIETSLLLMNAQTIKIYQDVLKTLLNNDDNMARELYKQDDIIDNFEFDINEKALIFMAKYAPVAKDLRKIIAILKIVSDIERIGDYAINIAKYTFKNDTTQNTKLTKCIERLALKIIDMLKKQGDILAEFSAEEAMKLAKLDEEVDMIYKDYIKALISEIGKTKDEEENALIMKTLLVLKQLERAGDHITNVCEQIIFYENGIKIDLN